MKRKIYMTIGLIASGKSTYAKNLVKENPNIQRVSRDDLRTMTTNYQFTSENEKIVDKLYRSLIETYLTLTTKDIILDEQNLNIERKEEFKRWILSIEPNIEFIEIEFPITLGEAIDRDSKRQNPIGKSVIKQTWQRYEIFLKQMIERHKPKLEVDPSLPWCMIVDIDGTLSNSYNRKIFDDSRALGDLVIEPVKNILCTYSQIAVYKNNLKIIIFSGRQMSCLNITCDWLEKNNIPYDDIFMRATGDTRSDDIVKKELYEWNIKGRYNVLFAIDDRKSVCNMWIKLGIFLLDVSQDPMCKNIF